MFNLFRSSKKPKSINILENTDNISKILNNLNQEKKNYIQKNYCSDNDYIKRCIRDMKLAECDIQQKDNVDFNKKMLGDFTLDKGFPKRLDIVRHFIANSCGQKSTAKQIKNDTKSLRKYNQVLLDLNKQIKGYLGEKIIDDALNKNNNDETYYNRDTNFYNDKSHVQIDNMTINQYGIFLIEIKNYYQKELWINGKGMIAWENNKGEKSNQYKEYKKHHRFDITNHFMPIVKQLKYHEDSVVNALRKVGQKYNRPEEKIDNYLRNKIIPNIHNIVVFVEHNDNKNNKSIINTKRCIEGQREYYKNNDHVNFKVMNQHELSHLYDLNRTCFNSKEIKFAKNSFDYTHSSKFQHLCFAVNSRVLEKLADLQKNVDIIFSVIPSDFVKRIIKKQHEKITKNPVYKNHISYFKKHGNAGFVCSKWNHLPKKCTLIEEANGKKKSRPLANKSLMINNLASWYFIMQKDNQNVMMHYRKATIQNAIVTHNYIFRNHMKWLKMKHIIEAI